MREKFSKLADQYFTSGRPVALALHLIDIRHDPTKEDIQMLSYMNMHNIPYFVVFTKCDKYSKAQLTKMLSELLDAFEIQDKAHCFAVSAEKKEGLEDLQDAISEFLFPETD